MSPKIQALAAALAAALLAATVALTAQAGAAAPVKSNYGGMFTASETNRATYAGGYWLKVPWSALEPSPGVYDWSAIDGYLTAHPGVPVRLHVLGGGSAPQWLLTAAGTVAVKNSKDSRTVTVGKYWTKTYEDAAAVFAAALGARYDPNPAIASVNDFANSLVYDEPWIMGGDPTSVQRLYTAGLTPTTQTAAIDAALAALTAAFPTTVVELPAHSQLTWPTSTGQASSWPAGRDMLNLYDALYGAHLVVSDYGLGPGEYRDAEPLAAAADEYGWMHERALEGRPVGFQATLTGAVGGSPTAAQAAGAAQAAVDMHASWFEHSSWSLLTTAQVKQFDAELKADVSTGLPPTSSTSSSSMSTELSTSTTSTTPPPTTTTTSPPPSCTPATT